MNLKNDIAIYKREHLPHLQCKKWFYENMSSIREVIEKASQGKTPNGKMDDHFWRIGEDTCKKGLKELVKKEKDIQKCKTFKEIFDITEEVRLNTFGLGDVWSYDTALRIGFKKKVYPEDIYVQAGVKKGVKKFNIIPRGRRCLPLKEILNKQIEMKVLKAYEIENFFCNWGKTTARVRLKRLLYL